MIGSTRFRSTLALFAVVALAAACGGGSGGGGTGTDYTPTGPSTSSTPGANEVIATSSNTFNPASLTVAKGTTVTFTFQGVTHNVTFAAVAGAPTDVGNTSNASVQRVFATAGTFGFNCTIHPGMSGSVVVN